MLRRYGRPGRVRIWVTESSFMINWRTKNNRRRAQAKGGTMKVKTTLAILVLLATVSAAVAKPPRLQDGAKQDMKDAGHETKQAAKKTGTAVGKSTKKAGHETAHAAHKTGTAVENTSKKAGHDTE